MVNRLISTVLAVGCLLLAVALFRRDRKLPAATVPAYRSVLSPSGFSPSEARALLDTPLARVELDNVALEEAIFALAAMSKANICADWHALEGAGITRASPVRVKLANVTLGQALDAMLKGLTPHNVVPESSPERFPACYEQRGIVVVSTLALADCYVVTEYINIRPLVAELLDYNRSINPPVPYDGPPPRRGPWQLIDCLITLITRAVAPVSWRDGGGIAGNIRDFGRVLVITQTPENIRQIRKLLEQLQHAMHTVDFPAVAPETTRPGPLDGEAFARQDEPRTECINLRPLIEELRIASLMNAITRPDQFGQTRGEIMYGVEKVITATVDPETWIDPAGGKIGAFWEFGDILAVTQTPKNLAAVRVLLAKLHHAAAAAHCRR